MMRFNLGVAIGAVILVLAGCSKVSGTAKTDSAAADSIRDAHDVAAADSAAAAAAATGSPIDSVRGAINSTEGTIGETRKIPGKVPGKVPGKMPPRDIGRDSVIPGPYKTMDSVGRIKR